MWNTHETPYLTGLSPETFDVDLRKLEPCIVDTFLPGPNRSIIASGC